MRFALGLEYDGSGYSGWQHQGHSRTVQEAVEKALSTVAAEPVKVVAAGRTDAGVHATAQVVHFDTGATRRERGWLLGVNSNLPADIAAAWIRPVDASFDARRSALRRSYRYIIINREQRPALAARRATWVHAPLDAEAMQRASQALAGEHDFSAFRAASCQSRSATRRVERIAVARDGERIVLDITANAFLHHMVRNIVGSLLEVGEGARPEGWIAQLLAGRDRAVAGMTAAPDGLYLVDVEYPTAHGLPRGRSPEMPP